MVVVAELREVLRRRKRVRLPCDSFSSVSGSSSAASRALRTSAPRYYELADAAGRARCSASSTRAIRGRLRIVVKIGHLGPPKHLAGVKLLGHEMDRTATRRSPASKGCLWVSSPRYLGSRDGWMLTIHVAPLVHEPRRQDAHEAGEHPIVPTPWSSASGRAPGRTPLC